MAILNIKAFPDRLYKRLQQRAKRERRSVAQKVIKIISESVSEQQPLSILELQGLGKQMWKSTDSKSYLDEERQMLELIDDIGRGPVAIDTAPFIYLIERASRFPAIIRPVFQSMDAGKLTAVTSTLTLLETLVQPFRANYPSLAARYEELLSKSRGLQLKEISQETCRAAAQLRAAYGIKTPDALQLATAILSACPVFLTND